jgi:hypothetical protein
MKSAEEIVTEIEADIAHIHRRPAMWVGSTTCPGSANAIESVLTTMYHYWAFVQSRDNEFVEARNSILKENDCSPMTLSSYFYLNHPERSENEACEFVLRGWRRIGELLKITA